MSELPKIRPDFLPARRVETPWRAECFCRGSFVRNDTQNTKTSALDTWHITTAVDHGQIGDWHGAGSAVHCWTEMNALSKWAPVVRGRAWYLYVPAHQTPTRVWQVLRHVALAHSVEIDESSSDAFPEDATGGARLVEPTRPFVQLWEGSATDRVSSKGGVI